jgi:hypothetical protein
LIPHTGENDLDKLEMRIIPEGLVIPDGCEIPPPPASNTGFIFPDHYFEVDYVNQPYDDAFKEQSNIPPCGYVDYDTGIVYKYVDGSDRTEATGEMWEPRPMILVDIKAYCSPELWNPADEKRQFVWQRAIKTLDGMS